MTFGRYFELVLSILGHGICMRTVCFHAISVPGFCQSLRTASVGGTFLLPRPSALPLLVAWLQPKPIFTAGDTEHISPVHCQLWIDWQMLCRLLGWQMPCRVLGWQMLCRVLAWHLLDNVPALPAPTVSTGFSAVLSERSGHKQPAWTGGFLYPKERSLDQAEAKRCLRSSLHLAACSALILCTTGIISFPGLLVFALNMPFFTRAVMMRRARDAEEQAGHCLQAADDIQHTINRPIHFSQKPSKISYATQGFDLHQASSFLMFVSSSEAEVFLLPHL